MYIPSDERPASLLRGLWRKTKQDNVFNGAAALGFFLTLAIFPAMILVMSVIPYLPIRNVDRAIMDFMAQLLPHQAFDVFRSAIQQVITQRQGALLSLGGLATLWAASSGMYAVMQQLNVTYDVKESRGFLHARAVAIELSLVFGLLILVAFSLVVLGGVAQGWIGRQFGFGPPLLALFSVGRALVFHRGQRFLFLARLPHRCIHVSGLAFSEDPSDMLSALDVLASRVREELAASADYGLKSTLPVRWLTAVARCDQGQASQSALMSHFAQASGLEVEQGPHARVSDAQAGEWETTLPALERQAGLRSVVNPSIDKAFLFAMSMK